MDMKNRTLIFDLGGVLLDIFIDRSFGALMALGMDASILTEKRCLMDDMIQRYDRGDVSTAEFYSYIAQYLPQSVQALPEDELQERIHDIWNMMLGSFSREKMEYIKTLRERGNRVVMLSNTNEGHWETIERLFRYTMGAPLSEFFDELYLSFEMNLRKPEPEIFESLLRSEGVEAADCIFFDDSEENCNAARELGIEAVVMERNAAWNSLPVLE